MFNGVYFTKKIDDVAIGLTLGPPLTNEFLSYHEKIWLNYCQQGFYRRYVDDIFILFKSNYHFKSF